MSDPITAIAIGSAVLGGVTSAAGSAKAGNAAYANAQYQAQIAQRNQQIADVDAANAISAGQLAEAESRRQTKQLEGTQKAIIAGLGNAVDSGSATGIGYDTAQLGETDALQIRRNAQREALGFTLKGLDYQSDAQMDVAAGNNARSAGFINGAGTLLSTAGSVASMSAKFKYLKSGNAPAASLF